MLGMGRNLGKYRLANWNFDWHKGGSTLKVGPPCVYGIIRTASRGGSIGYIVEFAIVLRIIGSEC